MVPVRFVRACRAGHIGDIDWYAFVHGGRTDCRRQLWIDERGTSGDLAEVWVRCECGASGAWAQAAMLQGTGLGQLRRFTTVAGTVHQGGVRRAESPADPHGQQCLLPAS